MEVGDDTHLTVNDGMEVIPGMQSTNRGPHLHYSPSALKAKGNNASGCDVASPQMTSNGAPPEVNATAENSTVISASPVSWSFNFSQNFVSFNKSSFSINKKHSNNSLAKTQTDDSSDFMNVKSKQCEAVKPICNSTKEVEPMAKNASKLSRMKQITHIASKDASTSSKHHIDKPILPAGACHMLYYQGACKSTSCVNYHQLPTARVEQFLGKFILYSLLHTDQNQCVWSLLTAHSSSHSRTEPLFVLHVLRHVAQYLNSVPTASTGTNFQVPSQFAFILDCARVCDWGSDQTTRDDVCARGLAVARQVYEVLRRSFVHLPDHLKLEAIRAFVSLSECSKVSGPSGPWSPSEKVLNAGLETAPTKQDDLFSQLDLFWFRSFLAFPDSITVRMIYKHLTKSITSESEFCSIITKEFIEYHNKMGMYNEAYHALPVLQRLGITRPELYQQLLCPAPKSRASYAVTDFAASLPKVLELCGVICHLKVRLSVKYFVHLLGFLLATSRNHTHYVLALQQAADTIVYATQEAGFIPETSLLEQLFSKLSSDFLQLATLQQVFLRLSPELLLANAALMPAILARVKNLPPPAYLVFSALKERLRQIGVVIHLEEDDIYRTEDSSRSGSSGSSKNTTIVEDNCSTSLRSKIDSKSDICSQVHSGFIQDKKVKYGNDCLEDIRSELACEYDDQYNAADHSQRQKFCEKREQLKTDNPRYSSLSNASTVNPRVSNVVVASLQRVEPTDNVTQQRVDLISVENNPSLMEGFKITDSLPAWRPQKRPLSSPSIHSKKAYTIQSYFQHQASKRIQSKCIGLDNSQEEKEGASENLDSSVSPESFVLKIDSPEYCHHPEAKEQTPNRDNEKRASDVNKCIFACSSPATSCNSTAISKLNTSLFGCVSPVAPSTSFARNAEKSDSGKDHFNADVSGTNFTKTVTNNTGQSGSFYTTSSLGNSNAVCPKSNDKVMDKNQKCSIGDDSDAAASNAYSSPIPELRDYMQLPLRRNYHATGLQSSGIKPTLRRYHPVGGFNVPTVSAPRDIISNNFMVYHPTDGFYDFVEEEEIEEIYTETYAYDINANFVNECIPNPCERNLNPSLSARLGETCTPQENYLQSHSSFADLPEATSDVNDELLMETSDRIVSLPSTIVLSTPPTYQSSSNAIMFNRLNRAGYSPIGSRVGDTGPSSNTWIDASLAPHIASVNDDCASFAPMETCLSCQDFDTQEIHDGTRNTWNSISHRPESQRFSLSRLAPNVPMINSRIPIITYPSRQNAVERRSSLVYPMFDNTDCLPTETSEEDSGYLTNGPNINTLQVDRAFGGNINRHGSLIAADVKDKIHVKPRPSLASIARDCAGRKVHSPCPASSVTQHALTNEAETPDIGSNAFETDAVDDLDGSGRETSESGCDDQMEPGFYLDKHPICERDHGSERLAVSSLASSAKFTRPRLLPTLSPDVTFWKCVREGRLEDIGKKLSRIAAQYDVKLEQKKQAGKSSSEDLFDISVEIKCMRQLLQSLASDEHVQKIDSNLEVIVSSVRDWSVKGCETRAVTSGEAWCVCSLANSILERLGVRFHTEDLDQIPKGSNLNASSTATETNDLVINEKRSSLCNVANGKVSLATVPVEGFNTPCSTTARPTLTATQTFSSAAAPNSLSSEQRSSVALISILISRRLPFFKYQPLPGALPSPPLSEQQIALAVVPLLLTSGQLALVVTILTGVTWYGGSHDVETKLRVFHETTSRLLHNPSPDDTYLNENMTSSLHPDKLGSSTSSYPQNCSGITFSSSNSQAPVMSSSSLPSASFVRKLLHRCRGEMLVCRLLQALVRSYRHDSLVLGHARYNRAVDLSHLLDDACERVLLSSNRLRRLHDSNTGLLHDEVEQLDQHVQRLRLTLRKLLLTLGTSGLTVSSRQRELIEATEDAELYSCEVTTVLEDLMLISPPHQKKTPTWPLPSDSRRMRPKPSCRSLMTATIP